MRQLSYLFSLLVLVSSAYAHGPTPQKAKESIVIHAPVTKVWAAVKDFDDISQWHPDLKQSQGDGKNQSGGGRTLVFNNDASLTEELDYYNEQEHEYSYRLKAENTKAIPTSSHSVEIKVSHGDTADSSIVSFKSRFYRGDTGNTGNTGDGLRQALVAAGLSVPARVDVDIRAYYAGVVLVLLLLLFI